MTDAKMIFGSECDSSARRPELDVSAEFKLWFEKLTFAISKQRKTLAGQEIAALQELYREAFSTAEVLKDVLNTNNN